MPKWVLRFPGPRNGYNVLGGVVTSTQSMAGRAYSFPQYAYNLADSLVSETYPSGRVVLTSYDAGNRLISVTGAGQNPVCANGVAYHSSGAIQSLTLGNGVVETMSFKNRLQMTSKTAVRSGVTILSLTYGFPSGSNNGNVSTQAISYPAQGSESALSVSQSYGYDAVNKLLNFSEGSASRVVTDHLRRAAKSRCTAGKKSGCAGPASPGLARLTPCDGAANGGAALCEPEVFH